MTHVDQLLIDIDHVSPFFLRRSLEVPPGRRWSR